MLLPTSIVEIKLLGLLKKIDKIFEEIPLLFSISNLNLSTETKAISIPEKKAEKAIVKSRNSIVCMFCLLIYQHYLDT